MKNLKNEIETLKNSEREIKARILKDKASLEEVRKKILELKIAYKKEKVAESKIKDEAKAEK